MPINFAIVCMYSSCMHVEDLIATTSIYFQRCEWMKIKVNEKKYYKTILLSSSEWGEVINENTSVYKNIIIY